MLSLTSGSNAQIASNTTPWVHLYEWHVGSTLLLPCILSSKLCSEFLSICIQTRLWFGFLQSVSFRSNFGPPNVRIRSRDSWMNCRSSNYLSNESLRTPNGHLHGKLWSNYHRLFWISVNNSKLAKRTLTNFVNTMNSFNKSPNWPFCKQIQVLANKNPFKQFFIKLERNDHFQEVLKWIKAPT